MSPLTFTLLNASRLIDGTGSQPIAKGAVLIEGSKIVVVGNPTENINDLWNVADVFLAGRQMDRGSSKSRRANRQMPPD